MAAYNSKAIDVRAADETGDALKIDGFDGKYVELINTGAALNATIGFELAFDDPPTEWREIQSLTAVGGFFVDEPATHIRAVTSSYVAGTPAALVRVTQ